MSVLGRLAREARGGTAAEFALVLPVLLMFLFGIIDVGRLMWTWNRAELATQWGVRYAVVANLVPADLATHSFISETVLQGDPIPASAFGSTICSNVGPCSNGWGYDDQAFANIVGRMQAIFPEVGAANVVVQYDNVGLGYAGNPNTGIPDVAPLVTVRLRDLTFQPLLLMLFGGSITLPDFRSALTLEDGNGDQSY